MRTISKAAEIFREAKNKTLASWGLATLIACNTLRATHEEIEGFCFTFSGLKPRKQDIERSLVLAALFFVEQIKEIRIGDKIFQPDTKPRSALEYHLEKKHIIERELRVSNMTKGGYLSRKKVIGKQKTGFCRCCNNYEINKLEEEKIICISKIREIQYQKGDRTLRIIPA